MEVTFFMRIQDKLTNLSFGFMNSGLAIYADASKNMASAGEIPYETYMGYMGDFSAPAAMTSFSLLFSGKGGEKVSFFLPASFYTFVEFTGLFGASQTFDPLDIVCYWAGAGLAFGLYKLTSKNSRLEEIVSTKES